MKNTKEEKLEKSIGLFDAISIVVGMIIGAGIFFKPAIVFKNAGSPFLGIVAWIISGIITMASGLTIAEIAAAIPKTGGVFAYIKELYGEKLAFLYGWVQSVIYIPGGAAALAIVLVIEVTSFIPLTKKEQTLLAMFFILFITILNILSTKLVSKMQSVVTVTKLIPIAIIIIVGFIKGSATGNVILNISGSNNVSGFGAALLGTLWAYDGWISVGNMAGELKNPKRDLPKSISIGIATTMVVYVLINIALVKILPINILGNSAKPASDAAIVLLGPTGSKLISIGIIISIFGTLNGYLMTGVRIPFAMARERLIPNFFGVINKKFQTPVNGLIVEGIIACIYVLTGSFNTITDIIMFVLWIFFTMTVAGIFKLRRDFGHLDKPYKVPLYPFIPIIGILGSSYIIISTLFTNTLYAIIGIALTLLGLPVYYFIQNKK